MTTLKKQLEKKQKELDSTILKCPKCEGKANWYEIRNFESCGDCVEREVEESRTPDTIKQAVKKRVCPDCGHKLKEKYVSGEQDGQDLSAYVDYCQNCGFEW